MKSDKEQKMTQAYESFPTPLQPPGLFQGARLGIVAPASPFDKHKFEGGLAVLEEMGFEPMIAEGIFKKDRYLAGADRYRADLVNRYFDDDDIHALVCARGGYGSMRILDHLDFTLIREKPKIVVGFSDNSALLWSLYQQCGLASLHGPTVTTLGQADALTRTNFYAALTSDQKVILESAAKVTIKPGQASGPVVGGNLTTLCHLLGTPFAPWFKGCLVVLEDRGEAPYRIDRMLTQMKLAGCFNQVAGLALGSFEDCGAMEEVYTIVEDIFGEMPIPMLGGFEVGHGTRNLTFPIGLMATLDTDRGLLAYHNPSTVPAA